MNPSSILKMKKHNFFAGPAILPAQVIEEATAATKDFEGMGLSILEISHRSKQFEAVLAEANQSVKELLGLDDQFEVLFLTGGASSQFYMTPLNLLRENETACYLDTGAWSTKAIKEAKLYGNIVEVGSSKDKNYSYIPKGYTVPSDAKYLHLTSNNTIFGTQHKSLPETSAPIVCDMSSDIFSRPIDAKRYGLIYAGAQKNLGPAGTTLVMVRKDMLGKVDRAIPTMLNYETHIKKNSSFNTPPVFPIYVCLLTMRWLKQNGGLEAIQVKNQEKANLLYSEIDRNPCFTGSAAIEDRSLMNVCFIPTQEAFLEPFKKACDEAGCMGTVGHRSVGGFRASIYNAMPIESVQVLVDLMKDFGQKHG